MPDPYDEMTREEVADLVVVELRAAGTADAVASFDEEKERAVVRCPSATSDEWMESYLESNVETKAVRFEKSVDDVTEMHVFWYGAGLGPIRIRN